MWCSPAELVPLIEFVFYIPQFAASKKKKQPFLFLFFSSSPPLGPQLVSVCKSWGLGCQMSGLVLSCQREEWAEMIDDWEAWNPNLHCKCFFYKKAGATHSAYIQGHFAYHYTHCFPLPTSHAIHTGPDFSPERAHSLPSMPPLLLSQARAQNVGIPNPNQIKK